MEADARVRSSSGWAKLTDDDLDRIDEAMDRLE